MRRLLILLLTSLSTGCSTVGKFDNRLTMTLSGDRAFVNSLYGSVGITTEISQADAQVLKELIQLREAVKAYLLRLKGE